jgi:hypothetical protein
VDCPFDLTNERNAYIICFEIKDFEMSRILDANLVFAGKEPKFQGEISQSNLMTALSWYSQNKTKKDSLKYACDFLKKKHKLDAATHVKKKSSTFGFLCRIISNGGVLSDKDRVNFENEIEELKQLAAKTKTKVVVEDKPAAPNIQDRIREKSSTCIGELEGMSDDLILSDFKREMSPYSIMHNMDIKTVHVRHITEWAKKKRSEFDTVMNTDDKELKEGYSNFKKIELKKMVGFYDQVILDCVKINGESQVNRKPRKRKEKTPEQLTAKVVICEKFEEFKLTSVKATEIIGASQLWVYNTKNKKLGVYNAEDAGGFSVKGTTITNFSEEKSTQKTLRKPADVLPEVLKGGKVFLRNVLTNIRAVESKLNGRLNKDIILLRVIK